MTNIRMKGKTAKSATKITVGPKEAPVSKSNKSAKPRQPSQPSPKELVAPTQHNKTPMEEISYLLDNLPLKA